ncbi:MAG TPA: hypothetical protein VK821_11600 [Dehalococcoidia bacterium]|nr:hypothetical protein [Dehalococcoidia bacterium]
MSDNNAPSTDRGMEAWLLLAIGLLVAPLCAAWSSQSSVTQMAGGAADSPEPLGTVIVLQPPSPTPPPAAEPTLQIDYPAGWNLIAGSGSPIVGADGPLYTLQAGDDGYRTVLGSSPLQSNQGYWAYFDAPAQEKFPVFGTGSGIALPPGQWVMIGRAVNAPPQVTGPPDLLLFIYNTSTQAYERTLYVAPWQGAWAFSHAGGMLGFTPPGAPALPRGSATPVVGAQQTAVTATEPPGRRPVLEGSPEQAVAHSAHPTFTPGAAAQAPATRSVILAVQRDHQLHIFDAATLEPLGTVALNNLADSVQARPDGQMLFIRQAETADGNGCCALFALDLTTAEMCRLVAPSVQGVPVTDSRVFNQRGDIGIEVFNAQTLQQLPTMTTAGVHDPYPSPVYDLIPSPGGRWLFGISRFPTASLDLFDASAGVLVHDWPLTFPGVEGYGDYRSTSGFTGAWLNGRFYLYANSGTAAYLWTANPDAEELSPPTPVTVAVSDLIADALPVFPSALAAGNDQLFLYEPRGWWFKTDDRAGTPGGGIFALNPTSATVTAQFAPEVDFAQVVASSDQHELVGVNAGDRNGSLPVSMLALDSGTGSLLGGRNLASDVWSIAAARVPESTLPLGDMQPAPCSHPEPALGPPAPTPGTAPSR